MNRTDRLLAIVLELQARRYTRAEDLAEQFEVSTRTIYRDVLALCEAGVPVISTPGYGYMLSPGYFLPPLMLTADEAGLLLLGAAFVAEQVDTPYRETVEAARKKIDKILPETTRGEVEFLRDSLRFVSRPRLHAPEVGQRLTVIRRAIRRREVLRLAYQARYGEPGVRDVEPHGLVCMEGRWLMAAYCRTREAMRNFRLDRIEQVTPLGERFTRRQDYTVREMHPITRGDDEVRVLVAPESLRWVREDRPLSFEREEEHPDGMVMLLRPRDTRDLLPWLLSWGPAMQVLGPPALRDRIAALTREMAALYAPSRELVGSKQ